MEIRTTNMKMEIVRKKNKLRGTEDYTKERQRRLHQGSTKAKIGFGEIYEDRKGTGTRSDANV